MTETKTILIVEDERVVARDIQHSLEDAGYHVLPPAASGEQAIRLASHSDPDLALMDIRIKGEMDGIETAKILRERFGIPVIYLTAYADDPTIQRAKLTEPYGYLVKPIKMNELYGAVEVALHKHTSDVQRRWHLESLLKRSQAMANLGSWELDLVSNHLSWSDEAYRIFGFQPQEFGATNEAFLASVHPDDRAAVEVAYARSLLEGLENYEIEHRIVRHSDGAVRVVYQKCEHIRGASGRILRSVGMIQDITERKHVEEQLARARDAAEQANQSRRAFLANMSHEIRTPLNAVVGLCHLLRRDSADPRQQRRLDQIIANADYLVSIVDGILDLSRIDADLLVLEHRDFHLGTLLDSVAAVLDQAALAKGLVLVVDVAPALRDCMLRGDPRRLSQILVNLGQYGILHTDRGSVRIGATQVHEDPLGLRLCFAVEDTGSAMVLQEQASIFSACEHDEGPSAARRHGGGLALNICQRLVQLMGSSIHVDSQAERGNRFSFELVLPRGNVSGSEADIDLTGKRLLVAEDHPLNAELLVEMLADWGAEVDVAADGAAAVALASTGTYDLILMDIQMPVMDGLEATQAIRTLPGYRRTPILALTAKVFSEDRDCCYAAGMTGYLSKPLSQAKLASALAGAFAAAGAKVEETAVPEPPPVAVRESAPPGFATMDLKDGHAAYAQFLRAFIALHGQDMEQLRALVAAGEWDTGRRLMHALQGVSAALGIQGVVDRAALVAAALQAGTDAMEIAPLIAACEAEFMHLSAAATAVPKLGG